MKNLKKLLYRGANIICLFAMFVAIHSVNITCTGKFFQPRCPEKLQELIKNKNRKII